MSSVLRGCRVLLAPTKSAGSLAAPVTAAAKKTKSKRKVEEGESKPKRAGTGGLSKPVPIALPLASFLGATHSSRANAVKEVWAHIKLNNLQDPANKKEIICDNRLKLLFAGKDRVNFVEITKLLSPHFLKSA